MSQFMILCFIDFSSHFLKAVEISALFAHSQIIQMPPLHRFINAPASFPPPTGCRRNSVKHLFAIQIMVAQEERQGWKGFVSCTQYSPCKAGLASVSKWQRQNIRLPVNWKTSEEKKVASPRTPLYFLSKCSFHWYKQLADFQLPFEPHCLEKPEKTRENKKGSAVELHLWNACPAAVFISVRKAAHSTHARSYFTVSLHMIWFGDDYII